jgi:hypothetical protein
MIYTQVIAELLALLAGVVAWKIITPAYLKIVVLLLLVSVINEAFVVPYCHVHNISNNVPYNLFSFIDMPTWFYVFYRIHKHNKTASIIPWAALGCMAFSLIEISFISKLHWGQLHYHSFRVYDILIIAFAYSYLYRILRKDYHSLVNDALVWVCFGCLLFHSIFFLNLTTISFPSYWKMKEAKSIFFILQSIAIILYNLFLCFAFTSCIYFKYRPLKKYFP